MDGIDLVLHRHRELTAEPPRGSEHPDRELAVWLADHVGGLAAEYARRPRFREYATWSLGNLLPGCDTPAAAAVAAFEAAAVRHARLLREGLQTPWGRSALAAVPPAEMVFGPVRICGDGTQAPLGPECRQVFDEGGRIAGQVAAVAEPFWSGLASGDDYFWPSADWPLHHPPPDRRTNGSFLVPFNPELHVLGDFVTRCLLHRVGLVMERLTEGRRTLLATAGGRPPAAFGGLVADMGPLDAAVRAIEAVCREPGEAPLRDACVTLTQVYVACHPAADVGWLGLPPQGQALAGGWCVRRALQTGRTSHAVARVAAAVHALRGLYAGGPPGQTAVEEAVAGGGLVVVAGRQEVFWDGQRVAIDWGRYQQPWRLLVALARAAPRGRAVGPVDLYDRVVSGSTMPNLFSRLGKLLPPRLRREITPGDEPGTYRLRPAAGRVHLFD